jgi:hypothetical protein
MKLYLAGPMRGYPEFNFPAFHEAAKYIRGLGFEVVSPAEMDVLSPPHASGEQTELMVRDIRALADCDGIALLPGWGDSIGATAEVFCARWAELQGFVFFPENENGDKELISRHLETVVKDFIKMRTLVAGRKP